jgi:peptidylprolyl isomerase
VPPVDLCAMAAPSGAASEAVTVEGAIGSPASATFAIPLAILSPERTVVVEGEGEPINSASLVEYAMTIFDAATGLQVQAQGYDGAPTLPVPAISVGQFLGCATVGSRMAVAVPETDQGGAMVWVVDVLGAQPGRATGDPQDPIEGMPGVELAENGAPSIAIPDGAPPAETRLAVLQKGGGETVASGDSAIVQYTGVRWSDGSVFDSSWDKGTATALVTTEVIEGYKQALEGQTVGSQVLVVIPPALAYGEGQINEEDLTGETLVFVVDILATAPVA